VRLTSCREQSASLPGKVGPVVATNHFFIGAKAFLGVCNHQFGNFFANFNVLIEPMTEGIAAGDKGGTSTR